MVVVLDSKRRLTLPKALGAAKPGDAFEVRFDADGEAVIFRRVSCSRDWLETMKKCPIAMDDLPTRSREVFRSRL